MSHNVFANSNEISSKASSGKTICNTPDVCFTPPLTPATPPGVPIPYPNTGMASDTSEGTTTVKISGQEVMLKNKSCFSKSSGDEAGSAPKKGVITSKNMGKVYFNAWSMDVKFEGENVPRNLDITTNNHMAKMPGNTPPMPHISSMAMGLGAPKCEACAAAARAGNPVNPLRGNKLLDGPDDLDFVLEGPLDLVWQRVYMSQVERVGFFGQGWITPVEVHLLLERRHTVFVDREGRSIPFPEMAVGESYFHEQEMCTLERIAPELWRMRLSDSLVLTFSALAGPDGIARKALLVRMSDANDNAVLFAWDAAQQLQRIDGSGEHALSFEWAGERLVRVTRFRKESLAAPSADPAGHRVLATYDYSAEGDLVAVTLRGGRRSREFRWQQHIMVRHAQPDGLVSSYEWSEHAPHGRVLRSWTNTGSELRFDYRPEGTRVTDQDGVTEIYTADRDGHWTGYVDGKGGHHRRLLDANGHLLGTVAPSGGGTRAELNERGLPVREWDEAGAVSETQWHAVLDLPVAESDELGRTRRYEYDARGNLLKETGPDGAQTLYEYDARGLPIAMTDALGKRQAFAYDAAGRMVAATDCTGGVERFEYNADGQLVLEVDALGGETRSTYTPQGDLSSTTTPDGATTRFEYDALGRLVGVVEPRGGRTIYQLRPDGMLAATIEPEGEVTRYTRDGIGRLLRIENPNGATFTLDWDELGSIVRLKTFEGTEQAFQYSMDGILERWEERSRTGEVIATHYEHDLVGRVVRVSNSGGDWNEFEYDAAGQLIVGRNRHSVVSIGYDAAGRRMGEGLRRLDVSPAVLAARPHRAVSGYRYGFDGNGNILDTTIPGAMQLGFLRYGSGHLHGVLANGMPYCDIERNAVHDLRSLRQGEWVSQLQYDAAQQLIARSSGPAPEGDAVPVPVPTVLESLFEYDLDGDLTAVDRRAPWGHELRRFRYDADDRVTQSLREPGASVRSVHWDGAANPVDAPGVTVPDNMVRRLGDWSGTYDGFGRLRERSDPSGSLELEWDASHQLVGVRARRGGRISSERYVYDAFGRRIAKTSDGQELRFLWEGERLLMEEDDAWRRIYVFEDDSHEPLGWIAMPTPGSHGAQDAPAQFFYLHNEPMGSPFALTDDQGQVHWHTALDAFGPEPEGVGGAGEASIRRQPLRMQGQYFDEATGLCYQRNRYFDPRIGRFISPDPIGLLGGENFYSYAPNPFAWIDPLGLKKLQNKIDGDRREAAEANSIIKKGKGEVRLERECYLRHCSGKKKGERAKDPLTDEMRRIDIVVINKARGNVMRTVEVTSMTAPKADQIEKERRIRASGGTCIKDRKTKKLIQVPRVSRVKRRK